MTDDWEQFSASPYQQQQPGKSSLATVLQPFLDLDCFNWSTIIALLATGKKSIWFNLSAAEEMGMSGKNVENTLNAKGIHVYTFALHPVEEIIAAIIVVDAENEDRAREILAKMGILLQ